MQYIPINGSPSRETVLDKIYEGLSMHWFQYPTSRFPAISSDTCISLSPFLYMRISFLSPSPPSTPTSLHHTYAFYERKGKEAVVICTAVPRLKLCLSGTNYSLDAACKSPEFSQHVVWNSTAWGTKGIHPFLFIASLFDLVKAHGPRGENLPRKKKEHLSQWDPRYTRKEARLFWSDVQVPQTHTNIGIVHWSNIWPHATPSNSLCAEES